jgi:hypothetical protein
MITTPKDVEDVVKRAVSFAKRRPTAKQKEGCLHLLSRSATCGGVTRVTVKPDADNDSASWRLSTVRGHKVHDIRVGIEFNAGCMFAVRDSEAQMKLYCQSLLRHEVEHGLSSDPDLPKMAELCRKAGVPFSLFGLFEDARNEHISRKRSTVGKSIDRFRWWRWLEQPKATDNPGEYFWALVNKEASSWSSYSVAAPRWTGTVAWHPSTIQKLYRACTLAANSEAVIPICVEFLKLFPKPDLMPRMSNKIGDEVDPKSGAGGTGASKDGDGDIKDVKREPMSGPVDTVAPPTAQEARSLRTFRSTHSNIETEGFSHSVSRQMTAKLAGVIQQAGAAPTRLSTGGPRLHMPGVVAGSGRAFRSCQKSKGKRTITTIVDMSGSMGEYGRCVDAYQWIDALMNLHKRGLITAKIWLTGGGRYAEIKAGWSFDSIRHLYAGKGSESVRTTMEAPKPRRDIETSDLTVVYTDACLTDGAVKTGEWRRKGIDVVGAVASKGNDGEYINREMKRHFAKWFVTESPIQLATEIVNYVARK